jgi:hypothetical protein
MGESLHDRNGIATLDKHSCIVWGYQPSHSLLLLKVIQGDFISGDETYLLFSAALYYEGPLSWRGANLSIAGREVTIQFMSGHGYGNEPGIDLEKYLESVKLYLFPSQSGEVKILAGCVHEYDEIPAGFEKIK